MTILEDLKSGRLVIVPREATAEMCRAAKWALDQAREADGKLQEPRPYTAEEKHAIRYRAMLTASPSHTAGLIALVEGMERGRDEALARASYAEKEALGNDDAGRTVMNAFLDAQEKLAGADAERDALRKALAEIASQKTVEELCSEFGDDYEGDWQDGYAHCVAAARRALTQEQNNER
jgi:hypothetical protein